MTARDKFEQGLLDSFPEEAVHFLQKYQFNDLSEYIRTLPIGQLAKVLPHFGDQTLFALLDQLDAEVKDHLIPMLPFETLCLVLRSMHPEVRDSTIDRLPEELKIPVRVALQFPKDTAGGVCRQDALTFKSGTRVSDMIAVLKNRSGVTVYIYGVDVSRKLLGVIAVSELFALPEEDLLFAHMKADLLTLRASATIQEVCQHPAWQKYLVLPVLDQKGLFIGSLSFKDIIVDALDSTKHAVPMTQVTSKALGEAFYESLKSFGGLPEDRRRKGKS